MQLSRSSEHSHCSYYNQNKVAKVVRPNTDDCHFYNLSAVCSECKITEKAKESKDTHNYWFLSL